DVSLIAENAERMPFADGLFDIGTSPYLMHERPARARRTVMREVHRALSPGGLMVIEDSAQLVESAEIGAVLESFPVEFHEPFFADYLRDDLSEIASEEGFEVENVQSIFVAKVVSARKPLS